MDNSAEGTPTAHYYYDSMPSGAPSFPSGYSNHLAGRIAAMTYGSSTAGNYFGYDTNGRVTQQYQLTGSTTYSLSYTYNLAGMLTSETYPNSDTFTYTYEYGPKLHSISKGSSIYANSFSYAANGRLTSETLGNNMVHSVAYNRALQVAQIKFKQSSGGSELQRYDYWHGEVTQSSGAVDTTKNTGQLGRIAITTLIYRLIHASPSGATPDEIDKYRAAMADLIGRIMTRPKCAELFGGIENALGTLGSTNFSVEDRGSSAMLPTGLYTPPVAYMVDNSITINRSGPFFHPIQTINFMGIMMPATVNNWGLQGSGYGALVLGHELGHVVGIYGANDHDSGSQQVNDQNTQKVFDACFK